MRYSRVLVIIMMFALLSPLAAYGQEVGVRSGAAKGPIEIIADQVEHDRAANTYTARGNVEVRETTRTVLADYVFLDDNTRDVTAEGNVVYEDLGDRIECEQMQLNLDTKKGTLEKARVFIKTGNVYINGTEIEKTGESQYKIKKGKFTTCGWDKPEWTFTSDEVDITVEGYAKTRSTTFHILGVPVFYIPWGMFPVKAERQSGFLIPEMALSSTDGAKFKLSYFWAISKDKDATMSGEYIEKRGVNFGGQFRYALREDLKGELEGNIIDDEDFKHTRYQVKAKHQQVFFKDLQFKANIWHVFDNDYLKDFGKSIQERSESQLKSTIFVEKPLPKSLITGGFSEFRNLLVRDNGSMFQYYPEITYFTEYIPVLGGKMFLDLNSSLTNFYRDTGDTFTRLAIDPSLRLPYSVKGLNTLLSATAYETAYVVNRSDTMGGNTKHRQTFRLDGDVNMQFMRGYNTGWSWLESMQSVLKPTVRYTFIPATGFKDSPKIDAYDRINQTNTVTYSFNHYLYDSSGESGFRREMSFLEVSQTYGISGNLGESELYKGSGSRFSDIDVRFTLSPIDHLSFAHESVFSVTGEGAKTLRNGVSYVIPGVFNTAVSHNYNSGLNNDIFVEMFGGYSVFEAGYVIRYTFMEKEWIDTEYRLRYKPGCWSTTLSLSQTKRPRDTSFKISFDLTGITSQ
ncbi:MAG: LPS assembly protein LptD [Syntrophorhabdaceae bacterium]|nr:LPS assembly protein LptD [Syntrophorhabdaceae bacterium]